MATATVFDYPDLPIGLDATNVVVEVELVASTSGHGIGFIADEDRSILSTVAKSPDETGRVEFSGLAMNADIAPAGTRYRASYRAGTLIYDTLYFTCAAVGPTHIYDILTSPPDPIPDPDFSADYAETTVAETTTSITAVSLTNPVTITPTIDGPVELVVVSENANHTGAGLSLLSIYEDTEELVRGFFQSATAGASGRLEASRRFPGGYFVTGPHTFEVKKWQLISGTATFTGEFSAVSLEAIRR